MMLLSAYAHALQTRAEMLAPVVALAFVAGEFLARGPFTKLLAQLSRLTRSLARKLDRENRAIATRVYRGIIAVLMLTLPATIAAAALGQPAPWLQLLVLLLILVWFGHCFQTFTTVALLRRAKAGTLALEIKEVHYLFADTHAVIRHLITSRWNRFAIGVVGACVWYVLAGLMGMGIYLTLASANSAFGDRLAFGWAARSLFALANALPAVLARLLLVLASLFTPHTHPTQGLLTRNAGTALAATLGCSLGGPTPHGETPWVGTLTARVGHAHLRRAMHLLAAATVLLVLLLAGHYLINTLIVLI